MARGGWKPLQREARARRSRREPREIAAPSPLIEDLGLADRIPFHEGTDVWTMGRLARFARIRRELEEAPRPPWPLSGDPNILGEHEIPPVRCRCCDEVIPWHIIKGWRN